jgi:uncharacterized membrane protein
MRSLLHDFWIRIQASYWFVPSLMAVGAIVTASCLIHLDTRLGSAWLPDFAWINPSTPAGARALLSTVAGSMITVAGVTFSMTLLAVSHASAQIGPRLLTGFMRDRGNQITLGTFIATFLYCLIVLRTVHAGVDSGPDSGASDFVPHLAIFGADGLAIASVAVLIYFIHHVPRSISVSTVVSGVGNELIRSIRSVYPSRNADDTQHAPSNFRPPPREESELIRIDKSEGYLRVLDLDSILAIATRNDLLIEILRRPGDFAVEGQPLLRVWAPSAMAAETISGLRGTFSWGAERTPEQDAMFPAEQLVEILGKAMSPGVNGQYTALLCIDQLERVYAELLRRHEPDPYRTDEDGDVRVVAWSRSPNAFITEVAHAVRQFARGDRIVTRHLLKSLRRLQRMPCLVNAKEEIEQQIATLQSDVQTSGMSDSEKEELLGI